MRSVILAALLVVACNGLANFLPLGSITGTSGKLTVTGQTDNTAGWDITNVVSQGGTDYIADGLHAFTLNFNVTYTGTLPAAALNYWFATLSITGPGSAPVSAAGGTCTPPGAPSGTVFAVGSSFNKDLYAGVAQYMGPIALQLTATGAYTGTIALYTYGIQRDTANFAFTVGTAFVAATKVTPTLSTFTVGAAANGSASTPTIAAVLTAAEINAGDSWAGRVNFANGASPSGVAWYTQSGSTTTGTLPAFGPLSASVGYWCGNRFSSQLPLSAPTFPASTAINVQSVTLTRVAPSPSYSNSITQTGTFTSTSGSADTVAPACTAAAFAATTITTQPGTSTVGVTTTCTDNTALAYSGAFIRGTSPIGHADTSVVNGGNYNVPLFQTGEANIIGVWAIDQTGNAVVYGDCGDNGNSWATMCGGGGGSGSSALVASFAVVMMCIAAVLAL